MIRTDQRWMCQYGDEWHDANPLLQPTKCGLTIIREDFEKNLINDCEYNVVVLWKDNTTEKLYWARDVTGSFQDPFERYHCLNDLNELKLTKQAYINAVKKIGGQFSARESLALLQENNVYE